MEKLPKLEVTRLLHARSLRRKEIAEATGRENYNVEVTMGEKVKINCVVNEGGTEITSWGFSNSVEVSRWLSPEMLEKIKRDRDCFDSPR